MRVSPLWGSFIWGLVLELVTPLISEYPLGGIVCVFVFPCWLNSGSLLLVLQSFVSPEEMEGVISRLARRLPTATLGDIPGGEEGPQGCLGDSRLGAG